jgi:hypothetical protein
MSPDGQKRNMTILAVLLSLELIPLGPSMEAFRHLAKETWWLLRRNGVD